MKTLLFFLLNLFFYFTMHGNGLDWRQTTDPATRGTSKDLTMSQNKSLAAAITTANTTDRTNGKEHTFKRWIQVSLDFDGDGVEDDVDNCPVDPNTDQLDDDGDGRGNVCDNCPLFSSPDQSDTDNDGLGNLCDNCPNHANPSQSDYDNDGIGNACDDDTYVSGIAHMEGNLFLNHAYSGVIVKSGNGLCWLLTVSNEGNLEVVKVNCPN